MIKKQCLTCKTIFLVHPYRKDTALYCSRKCHAESIKGHPPWNKTNTITFCKVCNKEFHVKPSHLSKTKYCSRRCYAKSMHNKTPWNKNLKGIMKSNAGSFKKGHKSWNQKPKIQKVCLICKKEFSVIQSLAKAKYCSPKCRYEAMKGHTPWNKNLKGVMGPNVGSFKKGHKSWLKGTKGLIKRNKGTFKKGMKKLSTMYVFPKGEKHPKYKGGKYTTPDGYIMIYQPHHPYPSHPDGYILEHRLVMEKHCKRFLTKDEIIHHKGIKYPIGSIENKQDNRIENLQLTNRAEHTRFHNLNRKKQLIH